MVAIGCSVRGEKTLGGRRVPTGMALARLEGAIAISRLLARFPAMS
jgi:cytochrome P450